jgi:hypothetical protein
MSTEAVESVLSRGMSDTAFADTLFANVEKALAGIDLTAEEVEKFKSISRADFDSILASPEGRKSFTGIRVAQGFKIGNIQQGGGNQTAFPGNHNQTALKI